SLFRIFNRQSLQSVAQGLVCLLVHAAKQRPEFGAHQVGKRVQLLYYTEESVARIVEGCGGVKTSWRAKQFQPGFARQPRTEVAGKPRSFIDAGGPDLVDIVEVIAKLGGEPHGERAVDLCQNPGSRLEMCCGFNVAGQTPAADCILHNVPSALTSIEPVQERVQGAALRTGAELPRPEGANRMGNVDGAGNAVRGSDKKEARRLVVRTRQIEL